MEMTDNEARLLTQVADMIEEADILRRKVTGLEKIEPLTGQFFILKQGDEIISREGGEDWRNQVVASKLNEVIEKVNLMMDYLNQGVGK